MVHWKNSISGCMENDFTRIVIRLNEVGQRWQGFTSAGPVKKYFIPASRL